MIQINIDLSKIDTTRIRYADNGGKYYNLTIAELMNPDQFGNTHTVYTSPTKEDIEQQKAKHYIGKGKEKKYTPPAAVGDAGANTTGQDQSTGQYHADLPF